MNFLGNRVSWVTSQRVWGSMGRPGAKRLQSLGGVGNIFSMEPERDENTSQGSMSTF